MKTTKYPECVAKNTNTPTLKIILYLVLDATDGFCGCPINYRSKGCYVDKTDDRGLKNMVYDFRGEIVWANWSELLPEFVCRCAQKAKESHYSFFALQFWGKYGGVLMANS